MRLRLLGLLVLLVCLWQGEAQFRAENALKTAAGANRAPKTLPNLVYGQRKEFGLHSQKKRAIIQSFVEDYLFKPAAAGGLRSKGAAGDDWLYAEGFSGPGFHYNDRVTKYAAGSAIAVVESAVQNAFIPRFWFNDFDHDTIGHLEATVKVAATAATAANKIAADARVNDRVTYSEGKFEAKFPAKVAASRDLNIYAHIDPFFYHTAPWAAVTSVFTDNPNGKIRAASINLFTGLMVGDLTKALTQNPAGPRGPILPTNAVAKIAAAFGYAPARRNAHATQFLNALSTKFYNIYHPDRNLAAGPAQTWGAAQIVTHLQAVAGNANEFKRANAVSRALAELYSDRLQTVTTHHLKSQARVAVAPTKVALIPAGSPYIMYWLLFASNANTYNTAMDTVYQAQATETSKHGAKYFTAENKPANVARTEGDTDQFISIAEKVRFRTRRSASITFGDALEKLLAKTKPEEMTR